MAKRGKRKGKIKVSQGMKLAAIRCRSNAGNIGMPQMLNNSGNIIRVKIKPKQA